jgi:hypothetical protein
MTLGNMRRLGVQRLIASCLNDACRHQGLIDVSKYPDDVEVPSFASKIVCAKCGAPSNSTKGIRAGSVASLRPFPIKRRLLRGPPFGLIVTASTLAMP